MASAKSRNSQADSSVFSAFSYLHVWSNTGNRCRRSVKYAMGFSICITLSQAKSLILQVWTLL